MVVEHFHGEEAFNRRVTERIRERQVGRFLNGEGR